MSTLISSSSKLICSKTLNRKYDVFLNFRGDDVRGGFLEHLYRALRQRSILTFKDDIKLEFGEKINDRLLVAIEESRFSIVMLSKNYAHSSWCLRELVRILERKRTNGHIVYPIFYCVEPSEVRKQRGDIPKWFAKNLLGEDEEVRRSRKALVEVGTLKGWV